ERSEYFDRQAGLVAHHNAATDRPGASPQHSNRPAVLTPFERRTRSTNTFTRTARCRVRPLRRSGLLTDRATSTWWALLHAPRGSPNGESAAPARTAVSPSAALRRCRCRTPASDPHSPERIAGDCTRSAAQACPAHWVPETPPCHIA